QVFAIHRSSNPRNLALFPYLFVAALTRPPGKYAFKDNGTYRVLKNYTLERLFIFPQYEISPKPLSQGERISSQLSRGMGSAYKQ
ncbi:MAG TPA: hypothetical protein DD706_06240, partial [Nitrospiraceae bacterium]|nr:hypothetical protein [Nitrospiraceae bacterium]